MYAFWRPGGPTRAVRGDWVEDVNSAKVGPFASRSWSEICRGVRAGSPVGGEVALANERDNKTEG